MRITTTAILVVLAFSGCDSEGGPGATDAGAPTCGPHAGAFTLHAVVNPGGICSDGASTEGIVFSDATVTLSYPATCQTQTIGHAPSPEATLDEVIDCAWDPTTGIGTCTDAVSTIRRDGVTCRYSYSLTYTPA